MKQDIYTPQTHAWEMPYDQPLYDEVNFTPWAEPGWFAWNGMSPEIEVVQFVASLVRLLKPTVTIETGVGQGHMTRAITRVLGDTQMLVCFESDPDWHAAIRGAAFWEGSRATLVANQTPSRNQIGSADFTWLDSDFKFRLDEIELWHQYGHGVAVIHDTGERHEGVTMHQTVKEKIVELGMDGVWLHNPRGSFVAIQPGRP